MENKNTQLGRILDSSYNEIYIFLADTLKFIQVSQGARHNLGYAMKELTELTPVDLKPEFTQETFEALIAPLRTKEKSVISFETNHIRKDGSIYPSEARLQLMHDETPPVFVAIVQDISVRNSMDLELKRYRERLEEMVEERTNDLGQTMRRLEFALDTGSEGFWDWNLVTGECFLSPKWIESLGYDLDEIKPHISSWEKLVHPDDMPRLKEVLTKHLEGDTPSYQFENRLLTKSGKWRWNLDRGRVVERDENGKALRMVGTHTDITEQKQTEQDLKNTYEQLLHAEKLSALGKLTGAIAHEFNNPLQGVTSVIEQVHEQASLSDSQKELMALAIKECDRMSSLVKKLQDFYRPSSGAKGLTDIHQVIDDITSLLEPHLAQREITLEKQYASGLPKIMTVEDQVKQVLLNLIQNAEEAISNDGGKIIVATETANSSIKITIQDFGDGISDENMEKLFEPFFTTKGDAKGTGLGLSICYGIIKELGGRIQVESVQNEGSCFTVTLPIEMEGA